MSAGRWLLRGRARSWGWHGVTVGVPAALVLLNYSSPWDYPELSALVGCAALVLRKRWPRITWLLCLPGLLGGLGWSSVVVANFAVGKTVSTARHLVPWVVGAGAVASLPVLLTQQQNLQTWIQIGVSVLFISGAPAVLGAFVNIGEQLTASLRELRAARAGELAARAESARADERARIAREIHDVVGHHATLIAVESAALASTTGEEQARETALQLRSQAKEALAEMRAALGLLESESYVRDTGLEQIPELVERSRAAGVPVRLEDAVAEPDEVSAGVGRAAYRVVQEALTNASRHAPGADVVVRLEVVGEDLRVDIINSATSETGGEHDGHGSGLAGLAERVDMVGGTLTADARSDGGFGVAALLPVGTVGDGDERGAAREQQPGSVPESRRK